MQHGKYICLIVDDELCGRQNLALYLANHHPDFAILFAENGIQALNIIRGERPDIVFLDINMPLMSGMDVLSTLFEGGQSHYIVFMTVVQEPKVLQQALRLGIRDYIFKPLNTDEIHTVINRFKEYATQDNTRYEKLSFSTNKGVLSIFPHEIAYLKAEKKHCELWTTQAEKIRLTQTLLSVEHTLARFPFLQRISKSYLLNVNHIFHIETKTGIIDIKTNEVYLKIKVPLKALKEYLGSEV